MANDVKSGIGYLIPASGVVGFIIALLLASFFLVFLLLFRNIGLVLVYACNGIYNS